MSELTVRLAATALRILTSKGAECVLERRSYGPLDAAGDRLTSISTSEARGVEFPTPGDVERNGQQVRRGTVLMTAVEPAPEPGDVVVINDHELLVELVKNWAPDGVLIYSDLEVAL